MDSTHGYRISQYLVQPCRFFLTLELAMMVLCLPIKAARASSVAKRFTTCYHM